MVRKFEGYLKPVTRNVIEQFLRGFETQDIGVALKLLQHVDYYSNDRTSQLIRPLAKKIKAKTNTKLENVFFSPTDFSSGSSTDLIIRKLRNDLRLEDDKFAPMFIRHVQDLSNFAITEKDQIENLKAQINAIENRHDYSESNTRYKEQIRGLQLQISDLEVQQIKSTAKTIVFVDDFIGSGKSIVDFWDTVSPYYNEDHQYYLAVLVAHKQGIENIKANTPIEIICATNPLPYSKKVFHADNTDFDENEKNVLKKYCDKMKFSQENRYGYRNTQSLVIFYERASNNILPILYSRKNKWPAPFPRNRFPPDHEELNET